MLARAVHEMCRELDRTQCRSRLVVAGVLLDFAEKIGLIKGYPPAN